MIPLEVVNESFKRPPTSAICVKERERKKIEADMKKFLEAGGKVTLVEQGVSHDFTNTE
jgi:hypothetical protein